MTTGRKPVPTALKELRGNPGKGPLNKNEPKPRPGIPAMPDALHGPEMVEARKEWRWAVKEIAPGVLTQADKSMLELYCQLRAKVRERFAIGEVPNPTIIAQVRALAAAFGLEPSSRARLSVSDGKQDVDPFEALMNGSNRVN